MILVLSPSVFDQRIESKALSVMDDVFLRVWPLAAPFVLFSQML